VGKSYENPWAILSVKLDLGHDNSHCWEATRTILENCLHTIHGKYYPRGSWCPGGNCIHDEYYIEMKLASTTNCGGRWPRGVYDKKKRISYHTGKKTIDARAATTPCWRSPCVCRVLEGMRYFINTMYLQISTLVRKEKLSILLILVRGPPLCEPWPRPHTKPLVELNCEVINMYYPVQ
jgi:hypothetical protein